MTYALLNRLTALPGQRDRVIEILLESGKLFDDNPACLIYLVSESVDDPDLIWVTDLWTNEQEHARALARPELKPFIDEAIRLLAGPPEQIEIRPVGGRGPALRARS
jgi:quinol monooxygenase YgiN